MSTTERMANIDRLMDDLGERVAEIERLREELRIQIERAEAAEDEAATLAGRLMMAKAGIERLRQTLDSLVQWPEELPFLTEDELNILKAADAAGEKP